jgi:hypothetical protein
MSQSHQQNGLADPVAVFVDDLIDRRGLELNGIFLSFHLHGPSSVLTSLFVY